MSTLPTDTTSSAPQPDSETLISDVSAPDVLPSDILPSDILIVGAGPAGATISLFLSQAKIPHTIIDKATFPRDKADGNVYGTKVIEVLDTLSLDYFPELMSQVDTFLGCDTAQIFTPNGNRFNLRFPHLSAGEKTTVTEAQTVRDEGKDAPCFTMNRRDFDHFLVKKLDETYADQRFGTSLKTVEKPDDQGRWQITLETNGETTTISPKLVVAADGANSTFLKAVGVQIPDQRCYDTVQGYFRGVTGFEDTPAGQYFHFEGHFLPECTPGFFFVVPLANNIFNVGIGKPRCDVQKQNTDLTQLLEDIMHSHPQFAERFAHAEPVGDWRPWPITAAGTDQAPISGNGYLAVGDAAGLSMPLAYFGTGNAMISGMIAAQQIQQFVNQQQFDAATLAAYDRAIYNKLQKEFQVAMLARSFLKQNWLFNLISSSTFVKSVFRRSFKKTSPLLKKL